MTNADGPETTLAKYGIAQRDGTSFVMPRGEADALIASAHGDPRAMEKALGLPEGFLDSKKVLRIDIDHPGESNLRVPSGSEAAANEQWVPGGRLPDGASEAIVDGGEIPESGYHLSDAGRKGDVMKFEDTYFSREDRYSLGVESSSDRHYASIPVSNGIVDYEEYYDITPDQFREFSGDRDAAIAFVESCRRHQQDDLLIQKPGSNRGTPV